MELHKPGTSGRNRIRAGPHEATEARHSKTPVREPDGASAGPDVLLGELDARGSFAVVDGDPVHWLGPPGAMAGPEANGEN